jgi:hypothetical protein
MPFDDPKINEAIALLNQLDRATLACRTFLKEQGEFGSDPIMLKIWLAERVSRLPRPAPAADPVSVTAPAAPSEPVASAAPAAALDIPS